MITPRELETEVPVHDDLREQIRLYRDAVRRIVHKEDDRLLMIVGPCSIHDPEAAHEYAARLRELADDMSDRMLIVMRAYLEKPRTTIGWKGFLNDPQLDGRYDIEEGFRRSRTLLKDIAELGVPCATEFVSTFTYHYVGDLVAWAAIGARTSESQVHREMASALEMPVGFKNTTSGDIDAAVNAIVSARSPHTFLSIDRDGAVTTAETDGNPDTHLILRGGSDGPNYDPQSVGRAREIFRAQGIDPAIVVDSSHANSNKQYDKQPEVFEAVLRQRVDGDRDIVGLMMESFLEPGNQKLSGAGDLQYGVSITDECLGWEQTKELLRAAYRSLE